MKLLEYNLTDKSHNVDREEGIIRNVKILGLQSGNGYTYTENCLQNAVGLYEGQSINIDHNRQPSERPVSDHFGELFNVKYVPGSGLFGDLKYLKSHPEAEVILERAERMPSHFGLSHDAAGKKTVTSTGEVQVELIEQVNSVDIVLKPATNKSLFESVEQQQMPITLRQLVTQHKKPSYVKERLYEMLTDPDVAPETEVPVVEEATPEDQLMQGLLAAICQKLEAAAKEDPDMLKKVMKVMGIDDSLSAVGASSQSSSTEPVEEGEAGNKKMQESINSLQQQFNIQRAENLLLKSGKQYNDELVPVVARLTESEQEVFISNLPSKAEPKQQTSYELPHRSPSALMESEEGKSEFDKELERLN